MQVQQIIDNLPEQAKRSVLYSLVGSLNASVVGTANSIVARLERDGYDIVSLEPREVVELCKSFDDKNATLLGVRRTARTAQNLRDQLVVLTNNDDDGSIKASIDFMTTGTGRKLDVELIKETLAAAGIKDVDAAHIQSMNTMNNVQRAETLSARRGAIEWVIEHVLYANGYMDDSGDTPVFVDDTGNNTIEALEPEQMERVYDKLLVALNRARDNCVLGVLQRDRRFTLGDLPLLSAAIEEAKELDAHNVETIQ